jgi:CHAT domain-containing protein
MPPTMCPLGVLSPVTRIRFHTAVWLGLLLLAVSAAAAANSEPDPGASTTNVGDVGQLMKHWQAALPNLTEVERIDTLLRMAQVYRGLGRVRDSLAAVEEARRLAEAREDNARLALVLGGLSDTYLLSRQLEAALISAKQSVASARKEAVPEVLATALNHLGNALFAQQRYREALEAYEEGVVLTTRASDQTLVVTLKINTIHAYLAEGIIQKGISTLNKALANTRSLPASREKSFNLIALGHLAQRIQQAEPNSEAPLLQWAYAAFTEALSLAEAMDDSRAKSYAVGHLGELYVAVRRFAEADQLFRRALFAAHQSEAPELLARWHWRQGQSLADQGHIEQAEAAYFKALEHLATIQPALVYGQRGNPQFFQDNVGVIYRELADILLRRASNVADDKRRNQMLRKARDVMERFKTVELKNYFQDDCVTEWKDKIQVTEVDNLLHSGTAALYPIVFPERIVLLLSLPGGVVRQVDVPVTRAELRQTVADFRQELMRLGNPRRIRTQGWRLYQWLIKPVEGHFKGLNIHTLVIVPDDVLRTVSFAAFYDGKDFLVSRYAFVVTPGLTLTDPERFGTITHHVLLNGLSQAVQKFDSLPYVPQEIKRIASLYESKKLVDDAFRKMNVQTALKRTPYSTVLFATHGRFYNDPKKSFLLTYDDKIKLDELDRFIRISEFREQPVELLVLSACETAEGDERAALGLAGIAVKAGARSVMASLYAVNDASTAELVPAFFENLKNPTLTRAQALQRAQQRLLADARYAHPYHWAAFILIGAWF